MFQISDHSLFRSKNQIQGTCQLVWHEVGWCFHMLGEKTVLNGMQKSMCVVTFRGFYHIQVPVDFLIVKISHDDNVGRLAAVYLLSLAAGRGHQ